MQENNNENNISEVNNLNFPGGARPPFPPYHGSRNRSSLTLAGLAMCLSILIFATFYIYNLSLDNTITVSGSSSSLMNNEIASYSITVEANNKNKQTAVSDVTEKANKINQAVKEFGISSSDLQTTNLNVYQREEPVIENGYQVYRPGNWYASYTLNITLRDVTKSSELTSLLAGFDSSSMYGPSLTIDNKNIDESTLLADALDDSKEKATAIAVKMGKKIGGIKNISESDAYTSPILYGRSYEMMGGGGFPVEYGSTEVQKTVIVTYWVK